MDSQSTLARARFIERLKLHSNISQVEEDAIVGLKGEVLKIPPGRDFLRGQGGGPCAFLVVDGSIGQYDQGRNGKRQITGIYLPGQICNISPLGLMEGCSNLVTLSRAEVVQLPIKLISTLVERFPNLLRAFLCESMIDASVINKRLANIGRKDASARLAHFLCEFGVRYERIGLGNRCNYKLGLTQESIGSALSITPVHVSRTFQKLRMAGLLKLLSGQITVANWDQLSALAEFSPEYLALGPVALEHRDKVDRFLD